MYNQVAKICTEYVCTPLERTDWLSEIMLQHETYPLSLL